MIEQWHGGARRPMYHVGNRLSRLGGPGHDAPSLLRTTLAAIGIK